MAARSATVSASIATLACGALACGDDGGSTSSTTTVGDATETSGAPTTSGAADESSDESPSTGSAPSTGAIDSTDDTGADTGESADTGDSSGSTGNGIVPIELLNDGWVDGAAVVFMGGFLQDECWASTYVPEPEHYPFVVDAATMLIGGTNKGTQNFSVALWTVDDANQPDTELSAATLEFTGIDVDIDTVNLGVAGIESPVFAEGNFALVVCLIEHSNFPAIAADADGAVDFPDRNWIRANDGSWIQSTVPGVSGDWIMRAIILPAP